MAAEYPTSSVEFLFKRTDPNSLITTSVDWFTLENDGIKSRYFDKHRGHFLTANVRDDGFHGRGELFQRATKFNHRQISFIDLASLNHIGDGLEIDTEVVEDNFRETRESFIARHMGINVVLGDVSDGRTLNDIRPPYHFGPYDVYGNFYTSILAISYNEPCVQPGQAIGEAYPGNNTGMGRKFKEVAESHRGYVGIVSMVGNFGVGNEVMIVPLPVVPTSSA